MTVVVTDHALVRYLERVHGLDMEFFRRCAASECEEAVAAGASSARIGDHWFVFQNGKLVTVLDRDQVPRDRREYRQWVQARAGEAPSP